MKRLDKLRKSMKEKEIDGLFVLDERNQRYLSEFAFSDGLLFITLEKAYLITDFRYYEMALNKASSDFEITMTKERKKFIEDKISENGVKRIGFEGGFVSYETFLSYKENYKSVELVDVSDMIELLRQLKTPEEIASMQKAQDIADLAFEHILKMITPNMTELDVAVEIEYIMRKNGAEAPSFETIAVSGDASSLPHGTPRSCKLKSGFLTMDYGAKIDGYCSDMTRTIVIGKADDDMKRLYNTVLSAQKAAIDYLREGADAGEADKIARDIIDANEEYKGAFGHSLGHSVGLEVHEMPALSPKAFGRKLRCSEILTVEPGIYLFGKYGCRIEDMVAIKHDGVLNFTHSTKDLIEI